MPSLGLRLRGQGTTYDSTADMETGIILTQSQYDGEWTVTYPVKYSVVKPPIRSRDTTKFCPLSLLTCVGLRLCWLPSCIGPSLVERDREIKCYTLPHTHSTITVIAKVFRQADTEESGNVATAVVPSLAGKVLGSSVKESDMQLIRYWVEQKEGLCVVCENLGHLPIRK